MSRKTHCCPRCGNSEGIYARADIRWDAKVREWIPTDVEDQLDCIECDTCFTLEQFERGKVIK
jgi:hypothetical protein